MKNKEYSFSQYMDNSKKLFKVLFGVELYNKLNKTPLKSIDWEGVDIDTSEILSTFPNIKERFSPKWIEYWKERSPTLLDLYLQTVFHYGYQQCKDHNRATEEFANRIMTKVLDIEEGKEKVI
jgi:hypothetical protein